MKVAPLLLLTFSLLIPNVTHAGFLDRRGVYVDDTNTFYFDGGSANSWTVQKGHYNDNSIYKCDIATKKVDVFISTLGKISALTLSPDSKFMAFIEETSKNKALIVIDRRGKNKVKIEGQVQHYTWGKDDIKLYFITGRLEEGPETVHLIPSGVWIYDLDKQSRTKIADKGWYIRTVPFDSNIYFYDGAKYIRYNVTTQIMEHLNFKMAFWSPDRRYYYHWIDSTADEAWEQPYRSPFRIFDTKINADLPAEEVGFISEKNPGDIIWSIDSKSVIFTQYATGGREIIICNIESKICQKGFPGVLVGINSAKTKLIIFRDGVFYLESIPVSVSGRSKTQ